MSCFNDGKCNGKFILVISDKNDDGIKTKFKKIISIANVSNY
jgi:hypothetical protein